MEAAFAQLLPELRQDQQAAVGPAAALHHQGTEVGGSGAVAEALRVVGQLPAVRSEVDAGLGVLDDGAVLDVGADLEAATVASTSSMSTSARLRMMALAPTQKVAP